MAWTKSELKRSYPCNPDLIKYLRIRKKWSQKRLALESGYCERLICKAESGGAIASATIDVLAKTLSDDRLKIAPEDLISDPLELSRKFIEAAHTLQANMVKGISHFTHPQGRFQFLCSTPNSLDGDQANGLQQLQSAVNCFFQVQSFVPGQDFTNRYQFYANGNSVIAWGSSTLVTVRTGEIFDLNVTLKLRYQAGKLFSIEQRSKPNTQELRNKD